MKEAVSEPGRAMSILSAQSRAGESSAMGSKRYQMVSIRTIAAVSNMQ